jgi:hypothetical protein
VDAERRVDAESGFELGDAVCHGAKTLELAFRFNSLKASRVA